MILRLMLIAAFAVAPLAAKPTVMTAAKRAPAKVVAKPVPKPVAVAPEETAELAAVRRAFHASFPIYEMMRTRHGLVARAQAAGVSGVNMLFARKTLADATTREVTTPNNDTLYASAWLDLANGPVTLTVPDLPGRYNSAALMNLDTDNVAILGTRTGAGRYTIAGPGFAGRAPEGTSLVKMPTNDAWLLVRVYVNGADDLDAAGAAVAQFVLEGGGAAVPTVQVPTAVPDAATFLGVVIEALARSGRAPKYPEGAAFETLTPETQALWQRALPFLRAELKVGLASVGAEVGGWSYPEPGVGNFGDDDAGRAAVALGGLAALPRNEAVYLSARTDAAGAVLTGAKAYTLRIPPRPPAGAFWSLTMYQVEADGRLFFVDTPSKRYALGSGTRSLRADRDGSFEIFIQNARPQGERSVNWLPAPKGAFRLVWRAYLPRVELLDGTFRLPPVTAGEVVP